MDSEVRPAYKGLIDNSANKNDFQNQLYYINQLLRLDSLTQRNIVKITPIIQKEYDEKELLKLKKKCRIQTSFISSFKWSNNFNKFNYGFLDL
ncbi:hypothetical protein ACNFNZ_14170 [Empedobacter brevis]